ncbi:MAG: hypothetical protein MK193_00955 [Lentisphaeria bacterium]|nr:hypothetical protein [Lentisphaeria bacterium]
MNFVKVLTELYESDIDFILVGGVCAVLHGAPVSTFDLDILYATDETNCQRLLQFLANRDASFRGQGNRVINPTLKHLENGGHLLFNTSLGPIDLLSWVGKQDLKLSYSDILNNYSLDEIELEDMRIQMLSLTSLIKMKEMANRPKDQLHLLQLKNLEE